MDGLLIDTGCAHCSREFQRATGDLPLSQVVNTHCHEDHIGNNGRCQARGATIQAHALALPYLADPDGSSCAPTATSSGARLLPPRRRPLGKRSLRSTTSSRSSHARTQPRPHRTLRAPDGLAVHGDAYVGGRDQALRAGFNIHQIIASLKKLAELPAARLFPASGSVVPNPAAALASKIAYLEETGQR